MDVTFNLMQDAYTFVGLNLSIYFEQIGTCWSQEIKLLSKDLDDDWQGFDIFYLREIGYVQRIVWNSGDATFTNVTLQSDWNKDEFIGSIYDYIDNATAAGDGCSDSNINATLSYHLASNCPSDSFEYLNRSLHMLCDSYNIYTRPEFVRKLPLQLMQNFYERYSYSMFYNDAAGDMFLDQLLIGIGAGSAIFSNSGILTMQNATTDTFNAILDANDGDVYQQDLNVSGAFDVFDLYPNVVGLSTGDTIIRSCNLSGFQDFGFLTAGGSLYVIDTYMSYMSVVFASDDDTEVCFDNAIFMLLDSFCEASFFSFYLFF